MNHMKKVMFIATYSYPLFNENSNGHFGGSEIQISRLAKELAKNVNNKVSILVGNFAQKRREKIDNVDLIKTINPKPNSSLSSKILQSFVYLYFLIKKSPDVCFTSSANSTVGLVSIYCFLFRKKHIHRIASYMDCDLSWIKNNGFLGRMYQYGLERAKIVVCQTQDEVDALMLNHNIDAVKIDKYFECGPPFVKETDNSILWVGKASKLKRPELFIKLAKNHPTKSFIMICNPHFDIEFYEQVVKAASETSNLVFIKEMKLSKIQHFFNKAKVFVNTSSVEGFAYTFIQSGMGKTPILSLESNPDNFINKYNCGIYANKNFDYLTDSLRSIFLDDNLYAEKSLNVYDFVKLRFENKINLEKLLNLF